MELPASGKLLRCVVALCMCISCLADEDYCLIKCQGDQHTMCEFKKDTPGAGCAERHPRALVDQEKMEILNLHNLMRMDVASGNVTGEKSGPQPPAADMMQLVWDDELAAVAQRWADQCLFQHDKCRRVGRFAVGQNIGMTTLMGNFSSQVTYSKLDMWFSELEQLRPEIISKYARSSSDHYTQLVWASTGAVGCGVSVYKSGMAEYTELLVCNYGPGGNMPSMPVYKQGTACDACPKGTACSADYPGLCFSPDYANRTWAQEDRGPLVLESDASSVVCGLALLVKVVACSLLALYN